MTDGQRADARAARHARSGRSDGASASRAAGARAGKPGVDYPSWLGRATVPFQLVLEGGAMRNAFTCGVCDFFLDQGVLAESVVGTSAGALVGYNYVSGAPGRMVYYDLAYRRDWRFMSLRSKLVTGDYMGSRFLFDTVPNEIEGIDQRWLVDSPARLTSVSSNLLTGRADYHAFSSSDSMEQGTRYLAASASMPIANRPVRVDGKLLLDGGICDAIPFERGRARYAGRQVVVLTRERGWRNANERGYRLMALRYARYPRFAAQMLRKIREYNEACDKLERMHDAGEAFCIWPAFPLDVSMAESDERKLFAAYEQGLARAAALWPQIRRFLGL